jgi:hypothetical protein
MYCMRRTCTDLLQDDMLHHISIYLDTFDQVSSSPQFTRHLAWGLDYCLDLVGDTLTTLGGCEFRDYKARQACTLEDVYRIL